MGKIIYGLEQGSDDWLKFRSSRIGASDVPAILGKSPYTSAYQLWLYKCGKAEPPPRNRAMQKGIELEPIARDMAQDVFNMSLEPVVMQHDTMDYFIASLDGYNKERNVIWETKAPGIAEHNSLTTLGVPDKYFHQVQAQLLISGADKCFFTTIFKELNGDGYELNHITVLPNEDAFREIEEAVKRFNWHMVNDVPPKSRPDDYELRVDEAWKHAAQDWREKRLALEACEADEKRARERLVSVMRGQKQRGYGVVASKTSRMGMIDYKRIPELATVDLEKYRKPETEVVTVRLEDEVMMP